MPPHSHDTIPAVYGTRQWLALWGILAFGYAAFVAGRLARGFANQGRRG